MSFARSALGRVYHGWWNVTASFVCLMLIFGVPTMLLPFIYGPVIDEFGWTRAQVTGIASFKFAAAAFSAFATGFLVDRLGVRFVVVACCFITGIGMCGFLWVNDLPSFYAVGIVLGLSSTAIIVALKTLVSRWFHRNQGLSLGCIMLGSSLAGILIPFVAVPLIEARGWREAFAFMSLGIWGVGLPVFLLAARETPTSEELACEIEGRPFEEFTPNQTRSHAKAQASLASVVAMPMFWLIVCAIFLTSFVDQSLNQHFILFIDRDLGLGAALAARAFSATFVAGVFAKIGFGWLYDRTSIRGIQGCYLLMGLSVALAFPITGAVSMFVFALVRGVAHGGMLIKKAIFAKHCFGPVHLGKLIGIFTATASAGYAAGPWVVGWLYDQSGSYRPAFLFLLSLCLVSAALLVWVVPTYRNRLTRMASEESMTRIPDGSR